MSIPFEQATDIQRLAWDLDWCREEALGNG